MRKLNVTAMLSVLWILGSGCNRDKPSQSNPPSENSAPLGLATVSSSSRALSGSVSPAASSSKLGSGKPRSFSAQPQRIAPTGLKFEDWFGTAIAVRGDWLAVGVPLRAAPGPFAGEVFVYKRQGGGWTFVSTVRNKKATAHFGGRLVFVGERLLASRTFGTPTDEPVWLSLTGSGPAIIGSIPVPKDDLIEHFGSALATNGSTLVVSARGTYYEPGRLFVFEARDGQVALMQELDGTKSSALEPSNFYLGEEVAMDDGHIIATTTVEPRTQNYVLTFRRDGSRWEYEQTLKVTGGQVAVDRDRFVLAARSELRKADVQVFAYRNNSWSLAQKLPSAMGVSMIDGRVILSNGRMFVDKEGVLVEERRLERAPGKAFSGDGFVAIDESAVVLSEPYENGKGAVYVFDAER